MTLVELLVSSLISLVLVLSIYQILDFGHKASVDEGDSVNARTTGRAILELLGAEIRVAGYSPLGLNFDGVADGDANQIRLLADLDADGDVTSAGELNENVSWVFQGPDGEGLYELYRGVDLDGDWDFTDTDEWIELAAVDVVPIDRDGDGFDEPFVSYDYAPPITTRVHLTFGIQSRRRNVLKKEYEVAEFDSEIALRNQLLR